MTRLAKGVGIGIAAGLAAVLAGWAGLAALDRAHPPPMPDRIAVSTEIVDRDGRLLRVYTAKDDRWRLPARLVDFDPQFRAMLVAYEDKRFFDHAGVDPLALLRAGGQMLRHRRVVSGGSTITMQLARLLEPRPHRTLTAKLIEIARALQIEQRLTKTEILEAYLTLAPYGGNLEGARAGALAWFGKEPKKLLLSEAALLVALPQAPEARRPDRHPERARRARDRVLARMTAAGVLVSGEELRAAAARVPTRRRSMPIHAAHLADAARSATPERQRITLTLDQTMQAALETVAHDAARTLGAKLSVAMVLADSRTGAIRASVGSADPFDETRAGWIDMTRMPRSPGSTVKPLIYGLAFEEGVVAPETLIDDRPASFSGYRPANFDGAYRGTVSVREALQASLNVPAVALLEAVGPSRLFARLRRAGITPRLPDAEAPGLAIGLGGLGVTLTDLVTLYASFPARGRTVMLTSDPDAAPGQPSAPVLQPAAAWHVADSLAGVVPPRGAPSIKLAYKTGTSYGYRDAWAIGFDGRHVLGVWVGRADNGAVPGLTGGGAAAPILFTAWQRAGLETEALPDAPAGALRLDRNALPPSLRRFGEPGAAARTGTEAAPRIVYPPAGARIDLTGSTQPLVVKLQGGRPPFRWLANGRPLPDKTRRRTRLWTPDGRGYSTVTAIDASGRATSVAIFID